VASVSANKIPFWTWAFPLLGSLLLAVKAAGLVSTEATWVLVLSGILLAACVFAAVHHAEILALKLGEPFGSILLAVAVTVIEVGLVVSIMLSGTAAAETIARDTVFSAVMIVLNGVAGLCLLLGGRRHHVQVFQLQGAAAALAVLGTLSVLTLILPNYTFTVSGPYYSTAQLGFVGLSSLLLYFIFVFVQTIKHRDYFIDAESDNDHLTIKPTNRVAWFSLVFLGVALVAVVLMAKILSTPLAQVVSWLGFPAAFVGVVIAAIVLMPESIAAVGSAVNNKLQNSLNLALGSAIASIGLTIPAVAVVSYVLDMKVALGISPASTVLLALSLFVSAITLGTGRTTVLQGAVHLVILGAFLTVSAVP
jgi:Ca2+:H+ antiporter